MRKIVLFGLGLSLTAASLAGCGSGPTDGSGSTASRGKIYVPGSDSRARGDIHPLAAANGSISLPVLGPLSGGTYTAYLKLSGFGTSLTGLHVRVNQSNTAPAAGCSVAGGFPAADQDNAVAPANFSFTTGEGSIAVTGLTIPAGTSQAYTVRICAEDAGGNENGATIGLTVRTDTVAPANGTIDSSKTLYTGGAGGTIPLTSGFTDDRAVFSVKYVISSGTTAPAAGCATAGSTKTCVGGANAGLVCSVSADCPNGSCTGSSVNAVQTVALASTGLGAAVPHVSEADDSGSIAITGLVGSAKGNRYTVRVCATDVAGNTASGTTASITAKTGTATQPTTRSFDALTTATQEIVSAVTTVTSANFTTATLSVQCPNPLATPTLVDDFIGTTNATTYPFTQAGTCTGTTSWTAPAANCTGPRCTITTSGADPCPTASKKLGLAISCDVEAVREATEVYVTGSVLDNTTDDASVTVSCPNAGDVITAIEVDYGDPEISGGLIVSNDDCTQLGLGTPEADYTTAIGLLDTACGITAPGVGTQSSCVIPQGIDASIDWSAESFSDGSEDCPAQKRTAVRITCEGDYATSFATLLDTSGAGGTEVCISNTPIFSEGTVPFAPPGATSVGATNTTRGACGTGWKPLTGAGEVSTALNAGTYEWTLSGGDGLKRVYMKVHDANNNESDVMVKTIAVDTIAPARSGLTVKADGPGVRTPAGTFLTNLISWTNFLEQGSGVASYKLVYTTSGTLPLTDCSDGLEIGDWEDTTSGDVSAPTGSTDPFVHDEVYAAGIGTGAALTAGTLYIYRVCATDRVGRSSTLLLSSGDEGSVTQTDFPRETYAPGAPGSATAADDYTKPVLGGTFSLQDRDGSDGDDSTLPNLISFGGFSWSNSIYVNVITESLTLASGATGETVAAYCFTTNSNPANCKDWNDVADIVDLDPGAGTLFGFSNPAGVKLTGGDGTKTYYIHAKDTLGNISANPSTISAQIKLDKTPPTNPVLTLTPGTDRMTLSWTLPTDSGSGLGTYDAAEVDGNGDPSSTVPYKIVFAKSQSTTSSVSAPANCSSGSRLDLETALEVSGRSVIHGSGTIAGDLDETALSTGFTYAYRMCVTDLAGNRSAGVFKGAKPL